jgi:hypothetical protein
MMLEEPEILHKVHKYKIHYNSTVRGADKRREQVNRLRRLTLPILSKLISLFAFTTHKLIEASLTVGLTIKYENRINHIRRNVY